MKFYGLEIITDNERIAILSQPRPRQKLLFVLAVILAPLAAAAGVAAGQAVGGIAALVIIGGAAVYFYRALLISSRERLEVGADKILRWVKVSGLKAERFQRPLSDITPDEHGDKFLVKVLVHNAPGSKTLEGFPATLSIFVSRGEAAGYDKVFMARTIDSDVETEVEMILENLPRSRKG